MCLPKTAGEQSRSPQGPLFLCYITDRCQFPGNAAEQEARLLAKITECASAGVDYIQLREKDLTPRELEQLAIKAGHALPAGAPTKLLINSRIDVALASGAHGVHLPSNDLSASEARVILNRAGMHDGIVSASAHSTEEVARAESHGADFVLVAPVFEKAGTANPYGLKLLRQVCLRPHAADPPMPVLALGGITLNNAAQCKQAGASGVAAIRLFQDFDAHSVVMGLRAIAAAGSD
ncbi:MAG TPA: thiamine phosphate synthase [Candidatus Angelobacter sp.]|nr:thiamine phosphate synthase [Candidatus Angelobacter sp.]